MPRFLERFEEGATLILESYRVSLPLQAYLLGKGRAGILSVLLLYIVREFQILPRSLFYIRSIIDGAGVCPCLLL